VAEIKTSIDHDNPGQDDVLVGLVGAAMLAAATSRLINAMPDQTEWPNLMMRAVIYIMDMGAKHGGENVPSVEKLRDLCDLHLKRERS
jgi:hypothetical protein